MSQSDEDERALFPNGRPGQQRSMPLLRVAAQRSESKIEALFRVSQAWTELQIPPRPWIAPGYLLRGAVTVLAGPGSAGKSSLVVAWTAAHSMGIEFGRFRSYNREPLKCLSYNVEDDADELRRRYSAMARKFGVTPADFLQNLTLVGPNELGTLLCVDRMGGVLVNTRAMDELEEIIGDTKPDSVWLDPFVELHEVEENDNTSIRAVMARFRSIAKQHATALGMLFHTRKGIASPGDPDQIRGASSIVGAGRIALTLNVMTKEEAEKLGISEENRRDYFRLDDAKKNYSRIQDAEWFERVEYELDNGDRVAVPSPWSPPDLQIDQATLGKLVALIAKGSPAGPYSPRLGSEERSISNALASLGIDSRSAQNQAINQLKASGLVEIARFIPPRKSAADTRQGFRTAEGEPVSANWIDQKGDLDV